MEKKRLVLLVEDDQDNFEFVKILLLQANCVVVGAETGQEAIDLAKNINPDLILMDLSLPIMDGWTAASELKKDPATANIPLIALTAHTLPGDRKRALSVGFDGFISKPIHVPSFNSELRRAFGIVVREQK